MRAAAGGRGSRPSAGNHRRLAPSIGSATMEMDLPELSSVDVDGPIVFREWSGPSQTTFVLIHGLGGSHLSWVQVAPGLSGLGRVVAPDLPGFGRSPAAGRSARMMDLRRAIAGFVEQVATGEVVLVGNSMGGLVAMTS